FEVVLADYLSAYGVALVLFLIADGLWLGIAGPRVYRPRIGAILRDSPLIAPAAVFYLLYVAGLVYFAVADNLAGGTVLAGARDGALFGFFCYLTFNATSLALIRGYDRTIAVLDTGWGAVLGGLVAGATVAIMNWAAFM
ncbi:MAG: DUF2177 family protein, partial [Nitratireductor sp.]